MTRETPSRKFAREVLGMYEVLQDSWSYHYGENVNEGLLFNGFHKVEDKEYFDEVEYLLKNERFRHVCRYGRKGKCPTNISNALPMTNKYQKMMSAFKDIYGENLGRERDLSDQDIYSILSACN